MRNDIPTKDRVAKGLGRTLGIAALGLALLGQSTALSAAAGKAAAFIIDANTGRVLYQKDADEPRYPASLTKMMTLYLLFEALESGRVSLSTPMKVSAYAAARPPSKLGLKPGSTLTVENAILSLVTKSANDAAVVIGEHLGGSEERFAALMTAKARQIGMSRTTFRNANGLPNDAQKTTARDMATLGLALREHFPSEYRYFSVKQFDFRGRKIGNHNRLLGRVKGVDGIKTGYTNASGFNLVSSLVSGNRKLVGVVMGGASGPARDNQMAQLLNRYLPMASGRGGEPLVADAAPITPPREARIAAAAPAPARFNLPRNVPVPITRASINERVALAYGSDSGREISSMSEAAQPIVGRDALRAALIAPRPRPRHGLQIPVANSLVAPPAPESSLRPVPPGAIPGGADFDPTTTGSIGAGIAPRSPWVIQIAAMPDRGRAMEMLSEAKAKAGAPLAAATPFTQAVGSGPAALHRARFAGFPSKADANRACAALKKRAYNCFTLAN